MPIFVQNLPARPFDPFHHFQEEESYATVAIVPMLSPCKEIKNLIKGFIKSMLFVGFYMAIVNRTICTLTKYYKFSSFNATAGGFLGGVALIFETKSRQAEIALYCVSKVLKQGMLSYVEETTRSGSPMVNAWCWAWALESSATYTQIATKHSNQNTQKF